MSGESGIGYCKPPKAGQFKKGKSGNPGGRPKGSQNLRTVFYRHLRRKVRIVENGKPRSATVMEAVLTATTAKAIKGDTKATKLILEFAAQHLSGVGQSAEEYEHTPVAPFMWTEHDARLAPYLEEVANGKP